MRTHWALRYIVVRYMGEGFEILVDGPRDDTQQICSFRTRPTNGEWDMAHLSSEPTDANNAQQMGRGEAMRLFDLIANAQITAAPDIVFGIDGESHELAFYAGANHVEYRWFGSLPQQWQGLQPVINALFELSKVNNEV